MSLVAQQCIPQPSAKQQQKIHLPHLAHDPYLQECVQRSAQPFLHSSSISKKHSPSISCSPQVSVPNVANSFTHQPSFLLPSLSSVHQLNNSYTNMCPNVNTNVLPPPRSYYVVSWVPRALPEVVQLIKDIPSEEERCLINEHFELGMLVMRRCGVQNPEEIKCLLDGFREGTTRLSLKDQSSKITTTTESRNHHDNQHHSEETTGYSSSVCCTPTVERRRLLIFFNDHRASRPWVLCPAKHCIKSARTTGKVKGRVKILQYDQRSSSVRIPKLFMDCLSDFLTRDHYVFATFCPQQKYTDHELHWFGVSDRCNGAGNEYGGDAVFQELLEEHDTKGSHRIWPFEDYIIFSNSQAKILAVFKKKQPLLTLYRNKWLSGKETLAKNSVNSSLGLNSYMRPVSPNDVTELHTTLMDNKIPNGMSDSLRNHSVPCHSMIQKNNKDMSHSYQDTLNNSNLCISHPLVKDNSMCLKRSPNQTSDSGLGNQRGNSKNQLTSRLNENLGSCRNHSADNILTKEEFLQSEALSMNQRDYKKVKLQIDDNSENLSSTSSRNSSFSSHRDASNDNKKSRKRRRRHQCKTKMSNNKNQTFPFKYESVNNVQNCDSSVEHSCQQSSRHERSICQSMQLKPNFRYTIPRVSKCVSQNETANFLPYSNANCSRYSGNETSKLITDTMSQFYTEKSISDQNNPLESGSDHITMHGQDHLLHMEQMSSLSNANNMMNVGHNLTNGSRCNNLGFQVTSDENINHTVSYNHTGSSLPSPISPITTCDIVEQAEKAEAVLIKVMTSVLAHLEPLEESENIDLNLVYQNVACTTTSDLQSILQRSSRVANFSPMSKFNTSTSLSSSMNGKKKKTLRSSQFKKCLIEDDFKTDQKFNKMPNDMASFTDYPSHIGTKNDFQQDSSNEGHSLGYHKKTHSDISDLTGYQEDDERKGSEKLLVKQGFSYVNEERSQKSCSATKKDQNNGESIDCVHPSTDTSSIMSVTTTSSSMTSGTETVVDENCSTTWFPTALSEEFLGKSNLDKSVMGYKPESKQCRTKSDITINGSYDKEAKHRRKMMGLPCEVNAVLYHDLVRQFLSRVAYGLDHPPLPQKRIPDTVKRVVTKIVTDTIREINLALLSSSLKCYSETQIPTYLTSNNSLHSGIDQNNFSQFPNHSDNGTHSPLLHSPNVSSSLRESPSVSTQPLPNCWTASSHDINMSSTLNSTSGFSSQLDFQPNSDVTKNLNVGVPIYNSNTYDNIGSNLRLCSNSTTQHLNFPCYLNGEMLMPPLMPTFYMPSTKNLLLDGSGTETFDCMGSTQLSTNADSSLPMCSKPHYNAEEVNNFSQMRNNCTVYSKTVNNHNFFLGASSTSSSHSHFGAEDGMEQIPLGTRESVLQHKYLDAGIRDPSLFFSEKMDPELMDKHMLSSTASTTSSFLLDSYPEISSPLLFGEYINRATGGNSNSDISKTNMSPACDYLECMTHDNSCHTFESQVENGAVSSSDLKGHVNGGANENIHNFNGFQSCDEPQNEKSTIGMAYKENDIHQNKSETLVNQTCFKEGSTDSEEPHSNKFPSMFHPQTKMFLVQCQKTSDHPIHTRDETMFCCPKPSLQNAFENAAEKSHVTFHDDVLQTECMKRDLSDNHVSICQEKKSQFLFQQPNFYSIHSTRDDCTGSEKCNALSENQQNDAQVLFQNESNNLSKTDSQ
ncbi:uncharacterized protein LOC128883083 isoform X2 [Hylaeus volcanicus]|uniref:uncharacterized protein LOC128883083 isoform X2 n=1 Tax=Hylaeus volcanicus TaxID=313075 RepID=UPI0023B815D0|nr:uncharacterized protein LOC128883083 isoform X2 [Hylaeus volcanicus]